MPQKTDPGIQPLRLQEEFPPVTTQQWEAAIRADLKEAADAKKLHGHTEDGIDVRPYYRSEHMSGLEAQTQNLPGVFPYVRGRGDQSWKAIEPGSDVPVDAIRADVFHENGATPVQELGYALAAGVDRLAQLISDGATVDEAAGRVSFVFSIGSEYFIEIAKLRAARLLWAHAVSAFGPASEQACLMQIHARTSLANKSVCDRHTNLLRATTEALSAVIGGCDSLQVRSFEFSERLAMNVQHILREEAHIDAVADPAGGSYYIEALTNALAQRGWKLFQEVEAAGGFAKAKPAIDAALAESHGRDNGV